VIPHHLIGRFCLICNIDPNWLITGKGPKPLPPPHLVPPDPAAIPKPASAKRRQQRQRQY
jgi:hypothetical protein